MDELRALRALARELGVHTRYTDGLKRPVTVAPETLVRVCAALGASITRVADAAAALKARRAATGGAGLPPVIVAWNGRLPRLATKGSEVELRLEQGGVVPLATRPLPMGYHRLSVGAAGRRDTCTIISAPVAAWRRPGRHKSFGVGAQLAALRSARSRAVGDLRDLESLCRWVQERGGDLVTVLPLLPTFNSAPPEPSPYSAVSRLFWSELMLDLGTAHRPAAIGDALDVIRAAAEVRTALAAHPVPDESRRDAELARYAEFRGAQRRLGRNWRDWPGAARAGTLTPDQVDRDEERFHLVAQALARRQLRELRQRLERDGMRLGLDLAVGVHPDGYDPWSRQALFAQGMSVGAPPDQGFPSGQDWGFAPVLPDASCREGHRYLAASIAHQASAAGVLRVDHIMAWTRLYWIPHGMALDQGTYVTYPADEMFAILTLESHRNLCEVVGENLGTVPPAIDAALPRHRIRGMYLAEFQNWGGRAKVAPPAARDVALIGTHDTPTFAGWLAGTDIPERVRFGILARRAAPAVRAKRARAVQGLARRFRRPPGDARALLAALLEWLGRSQSPLVVPWLEDLWLEDRAVNLPGTRSSVRPNWQRPMRLLLDAVFASGDIDDLMRRLQRARTPR